MKILLLTSYFSNKLCLFNISSAMGKFTKILKNKRNKKLLLSYTDHVKICMKLIYHLNFLEIWTQFKKRAWIQHNSKTGYICSPYSWLGPIQENMTHDLLQIQKRKILVKPLHNGPTCNASVQNEPWPQYQISDLQLCNFPH